MQWKSQFDAFIYKQMCVISLFQTRTNPLVYSFIISADFLLRIILANFLLILANVPSLVDWRLGDDYDDVCWYLRIMLVFRAEETAAE